MKNYLKYSILITLTLMITIGLANAQPVFIGVSPQINPWEARPTVATREGIDETVNTYSWASAYDGRLLTQVTETTTFIPGFPLGDDPAFTSGFVEFTTWRLPVLANQFLPIGWVDIKMKYKVPTALADDTYRIEYAVGASGWQTLQADTKSIFDKASAEQVRAWTQVSEPNDGTWVWADIAAINVRISFTDTSADGWEMAPMNLFEVWATVYKPPLPPAASPTMSIQPAAVGTFASPLNKWIFVDIYAQDVTNLAGYQFKILFDPIVLSHIGTAPIMWSYYPYTDQAAYIVDNVGGSVEVSYTIPTSDPLYQTGVTGNLVLARVYFKVISGTGYSWLRLSVSFLGDQNAAKMPHTVYHGSYGAIPPDTYVAGWIPASPFPYDEPRSTNWVEEYPHPGNKWHLSSWTDNTGGVPPANGVLDASDQIDMTPTDPIGDVQWFHVDQIWEVNADPTTYVYMILTKKIVTPEFPLGIGLMMAIAPLIPIAYLWRTKRRVMKK